MNFACWCSLELTFVSSCAFFTLLQRVTCDEDGYPSSVLVDADEELEDFNNINERDRWNTHLWESYSWQVQNRETKSFINFLRGNEGRRPKSPRMSVQSLKSTRAALALECQWKNCTDRNATIPRHLWPKLGLELIKYVRPSVLVLVYSNIERDSCLKMGRVLYKMNIPTSCRDLEDFYGYFYNALLLSSEKDDGKEISRVLRRVGERVTSNQLVVSHLIVFLPSSTTVLRPPQYRLNYCVVQAKGTGVQIKEVFTFGRGSSVPTEDVVGWWIPDNPEASYVPFREDLAVPTDFQGNVVRAVVIEVSPYAMLMKTPEGKLNAEGYTAELCQLLAKQLNFTIEWVVPADGEFGVPREDGNFTGVVGVLQRKEADIAAVSLNNNIHRAKAIDFSPPVEYAYAKLLIYRNAEEEAIDWMNYVIGFHWSVWLCVIGIWIIMAVGVVIVAKGEVHATLYNYLFAFIGALAQQGSSIEPECMRGRIVFLSFWVGSVVIYTSYTASLTSQLAVVYTVDPFSTLKEALTTAGYSVVLQRGTSYINMVEEMSKRDASMRLFQQALTANPDLKVADNKEGIALIQSSKGKYAYLQDTVTLDFMIKNNCSFSWLGQPYFSEFASLGYAKNLSYANVVSEFIMKLIDSGITQKMMKKWMGQRRPCESSGYQNLGFSKTVSAFALLAAGVVLGVLLLLAERLCSCGRLFYGWFVFQRHPEPIPPPRKINRRILEPRGYQSHY